MNSSVTESIKHNARVIRAEVRGKSKADRWNLYACLMSGMLGPILEIHRVWINGASVFKVDTSLSWAMARGRQVAQ